MRMSPPLPDPEAALDAICADRAAWLRVARDAMQRAHSPYSRVRVGAALIDLSGRTFAGCNVENASYGLTICAERNAIGQAVVAGMGELVAIAITTNLDEPLMPCGACRQVLMEFAPKLVVLCEGAGGKTVVRRLSELLPDAFHPRALLDNRDGTEDRGSDA